MKKPIIGQVTTKDVKADIVGGGSLTIPGKTYNVTFVGHWNESGKPYYVTDEVYRARDTGNEMVIIVDELVDHYKEV